MVRFAALRGLGQLTEPEAITAELGPFLASANDSRVRAFAGEVLIRRVGLTACPTVRAQVSSEADATRGHFGRALAYCDGQRP